MSKAPVSRACAEHVKSSRVLQTNTERERRSEEQQWSRAHLVAFLFLSSQPKLVKFSLLNAPDKRTHTHRVKLAKRAHTQTDRHRLNQSNRQTKFELRFESILKLFQSAHTRKLQLVQHQLLLCFFFFFYFFYFFFFFSRLVCAR